MKFDEIIDYLQSDEFYVDTMIASGFNHFRRIISRNEVFRELKSNFYADSQNLVIRIRREALRLLHKEGDTEKRFYNEPAICALLLAIGDSADQEARSLLQELAKERNPLMGWIPKTAEYLSIQGSEISYSKEILEISGQANYGIAKPGSDSPVEKLAA